MATFHDLKLTRVASIVYKSNIKPLIKGKVVAVGA